MSKPTVPVRRLPVVLEAVPWFPGDNVAGVDECCDEHPIGFIRTLEGMQSIQPGYWVLTGMAGEHWGVAPEVFAETYDVLRWCPQHSKGCMELAGHKSDGIWHTYQTEEEGRADLKAGWLARNPGKDYPDV